MSGIDREATVAAAMKALGCWRKPAPRLGAPTRCGEHGGIFDGAGGSSCVDAARVADAVLAVVQPEMERLAKERDEWKAADSASCDVGRGYWERALKAEAEVARLRATVESVHYVVEPRFTKIDPWCHADGRTWPCPTITALRGPDDRSDSGTGGGGSGE